MSVNRSLITATSNPLLEQALRKKLARRAGLLHDIGKAVSHEQEGGHAMIGERLLDEEDVGRPDLLVPVSIRHADHRAVPPSDV